MLMKKPTKHSSNPLLAGLFTSSLLFISAPIYAEADQANTERWFEIEVILYKSTSDRGLEKESWNTEIPFNLPETLQDFLNPIAETPLDENANSMASDGHQSTVDTNHHKASDKRAPVNQVLTTSESLTDNDDRANEKEQPFKLLPESELELTREAKNISVHPSFRLLSHFAWRQPVAGKSTATPVRIAGGHDYSEQFEFNGAKKLVIENELQDDGTLENGALNQNFENRNDFDSSLQSNRQISTPPESANRTGDTQSQLEGSELAQSSDQQNIAQQELTQQPQLLPWVPEVDGSAIVYIYRNYLHLDAKLVFRRPGQQEVDIYSLEQPIDFSQAQPEQNDSSLTTNINNLESLNSNPLSENMIEARTQQSEQTTEQQFAWHFDSDFLNQDTEKVYTEKLFNYPLNQTRRMRSTELHYFDHPKIGMLVIIRPYELPTDVEESIGK